MLENRFAGEHSTIRYLPPDLVAAIAVKSKVDMKAKTWNCCADGTPEHLNPIKPKGLRVLQRHQWKVMQGLGC